MRALAALALCLLLAACMPSRKEIRASVEAAAARQDGALTCEREDRCALPSPLQELADAAFAQAGTEAPSHRVLLMEAGQDSLLARVHMIRAAREHIGIQTFIFTEDDTGWLILNELLTAARRGVKVQVLLDQLYTLDDVQLLARLAQAHRNFEIKFYNPTFGEAHTDPVQFVAGVMCCFFRFNQRMHNKLLLVDDRVGITGGRNYQNRYFDWDPNYNYRDRDVLVAGPVARDMRRSFDAFWSHPQSVPVAGLRDVRRYVGAGAADLDPMQAPRLTRAQEILDLSAQADNAALIRARLSSRALVVQRVEYVSDLPNKPFERNTQSERDLTANLRQLLRASRERVVLQTPYLVLSRSAQDLFRELHQRPDPPQIIVSTNSLASTDAFPVYALSHKYKRRNLRELGFRIHEFKPFPARIPLDLEATGALDDDNFVSESQRAFGSRGSGSASGSGSADDEDDDDDDEARGPVRLKRAGLRIGLHAKSMVIDETVGMVGTHNFDPRSDKLNTENAVIVHDAAFARLLAEHILADTSPENAWTIARRPKPPVLSGVTYSVGKIFEALPLFDFWPWRYATAYELRAGCEPLPPEHPRFHECYEPVGDFPEVGLEPKWIYTRILTAFGAGLAPIL